MSNILRSPGSFETPRVKTFEIMYADRLGLAGPGQIPLDRLRDLNGLSLPVVREEITESQTHPGDIAGHSVVLYPEDIAEAYLERGIRDLAKWWEGYAAATVTFEEGILRRGEVALDVRTGNLSEPIPEAPRD